jgi:hypothetical protein
VLAELKANSRVVAPLNASPPVTTTLARIIGALVCVSPADVIGHDFSCRFSSPPRAAARILAMHEGRSHYVRFVPRNASADSSRSRRITIPPKMRGVLPSPLFLPRDYTRDTDLSEESSFSFRSRVPRTCVEYRTRGLPSAIAPTTAWLYRIFTGSKTTSEREALRAPLRVHPREKSAQTGQTEQVPEGSATSARMQIGLGRRR